jgi:lysophospholipase L1-like esterase
MAYTNILARRLDREVINLGFSGNAKIDYEIAEYMASHPDPGVFVLEYVPNSSAELIDEKAEKFFWILRKAHPDVPVIFVQTPNYPRCYFDTKEREVVDGTNAAQRRVYEKVRKAGEKKLFYIGSEGALGEDGEATVDGSHFTDLGMVRYVDHILPTIKKALKK